MDTLIQIVCSGCAKVLKVKPELAGKRGKCPGCGALLEIPAAGGSPQVNLGRGPLNPSATHATPRPQPTPFNMASSANIGPTEDVTAHLIGRAFADGVFERAIPQKPGLRIANIFEIPHSEIEAFFDRHRAILGYAPTQSVTHVGCGYKASVFWRSMGCLGAIGALVVCSAVLGLVGALIGGGAGRGGAGGVVVGLGSEILPIIAMVVGGVSAGVAYFTITGYQKFEGVPVLTNFQFALAHRNGNRLSVLPLAPCGPDGSDTHVCDRAIEIDLDKLQCDVDEYTFGVMKKYRDNGFRLLVKLGEKLPVLCLTVGLNDNGVTKEVVDSFRHTARIATVVD